MDLAENFSIVIQEKNGPRRVETFDQNEVTIGRVQGNDIVLPKGNISKRHSRIVLRDLKFIIVDLKSTNGTYVNGKRINSPQVLKDVDKIYIGDFTLTLEPQDAVDGEADLDLDLDPEPAPAPAPEIEDELDIDSDELFPPESASPPEPAPADSEPLLDDDPLGLGPDDSEELDDKGLEALLDSEEAPEPEPEPEPMPAPKPATRRPPAPKPKPKPKPRAKKPAPPSFAIDLPPAPALKARAAAFGAVYKALSQASSLPDDGEVTMQKAAGAAEKTLVAVAKKLAGADTSGWAQQIAQEICGHGVLTDLLADESVTEIFVNGPHQVLVKRSGALEPAGVFFSSDDALSLVARRILAAAGVPFSADEPIGEARMADGTRVNAVHQTASVNGPVVTVTRSSQQDASLDDLVAEDVLSDGMARFLEVCVQSRRNVCICGVGGAGIGTMLHAMGESVPADERIVTVQQVARVNLPQPHVVTLEPRPQKGGPGAASMRGLVANALRMRPDRLIVDEVASGEAMELTIAMGGAQDGTLFTTYATSARDCLDHLETMILMAGQDLPTRVVREQIANSLDVIVLLTRFADGNYKVTQIAEVVGTEVDIITTNDIFTFKRQDFDEDGGVIGEFQASGTSPRFYEELQRRGESVDMAIFR